VGTGPPRLTMGHFYNDDRSQNIQKFSRCQHNLLHIAIHRFNSQVEYQTERHSMRFNVHCALCCIVLNAKLRLYGTISFINIQINYVCSPAGGVLWKILVPHSVGQSYAPAQDRPIRPQFYDAFRCIIYSVNDWNASAIQIVLLWSRRKASKSQARLYNI